MARRLNTRFVAIMGISLLVVGGLLFFVKRVLLRPNPQQFIMAAQQAESARRWRDAVDNWGRAASASPHDPSVWNSLGNAQHQLAQTDLNITRQQMDLGSWSHALEIDPNYVPAMKSIMKYWQEVWKYGPNVDAYRNSRDRAQRILEVAPNDPDAADIATYLYTTTIQGWMNGLETDESEVADAETHLRALMAKDPSIPELPYYLAQLDIHRGQLVVRGGGESDQPAAATADYKRAVGEMTKALSTQDKNAAMHYYASNIYASLANVDQSAPDIRARDMAVADKEMDRATSLVNGDDKLFVEISLGAEHLAILDGNIPKADAILQRLLKERGSDATAVVQASQYLRDFTDLRPIAEKTLREALPMQVGTGEMTLGNFNLLSALTDMEINDFSVAKTDAEKSKLKDEINVNIQEMDAAKVSPLRVVDTQSRMAMIEQDFIGTVQILNKAMAADPNVGENPELMWRMAQAYDQANQKQQAKDYCLKVILREPDFLAARKLLVEVLSTEGTEEARRQISQQLTFLNRVTPDDPYVVRLEILQLDPTLDGDRIHALYAKLPEKTAQDMEAKALLALRVLVVQKEGLAEATRLLTGAMKAAPTDPQMVINLARMYGATNRRADAIATVERGLVLMPKDQTLQYALKALEDAPQAELQKMQEQMAQQNPNPLSRELQLANEAFANKDFTGAEKHLQTVQASDPSNTEMLSQFLRLYMETQEWDKAGPIVKKLGDVNADQAHGLLYQFELAQAQGDVDKQIQIGVKLTTDLSEFSMSYYCLAQAYQAKGQYELAINNYDTALRKEGEGAEAAKMLKAEIDCYYKLNRPDQAYQAIEEGRRRFADDDEFRLLEIRHDSDAGKPEDAVTNLKELLRLHPDVSSVYMDLSSAQMQVAMAKLRVGDNTGATASSNQARDLISDAIQRFPDEADLYQRKSEILRFSGNNDDAEAVLLSLVDRPAWKDKAEPQRMLGQFYSLTQQLPKAEAAYAKGLELASAAGKPELQIRLAGVLSEEKKYPEALNVLSAADATDPVVRRQRVNVLVQMGRMNDAEAEIKLIKTKTPDERAELETGWALLELSVDRRPQAAEHVASALEADPKYVNALVMRARLKMLQTPPDLEGALADLTVARTEVPTDVNVLTAIADVDTNRLDFESASQVLETALRADPTNFTTRIRLAYTYSNYQPVKLEQALAVLQDGLSQPNGDTNVDLFNDIANVYQQMGKQDQALSTISAALKRMPNSLTLINTYLRLNLETKQYQTVIDSSSQVIAQSPQLWWAWQYRGQAKARLGDKDGGMKDLIEALAGAEAEKQPSAPAAIVEAISHDVDAGRAIDVVKSRLGTDPEWDYILILLYHQHGQDAEAVDRLKPLMADAEKLPPEKRIAKLQLAGTIYSTAKPKPYGDLAYATYKELVGITPKDVQSLNNFACVCADDFNPPKVEEGLAAVRRAMDLLTGTGSNDPMVEDTYGWLLILDGQTSDGMDMIRKAVGRQDFPEAHYHLGEGYLRMNRPQDAQRQVNMALDAINKAQQTNQPVSPVVRGKVDDLSNRVLNSLR